MRPATLPSGISNALVDAGGGKVTLVIGAGCSKEPPTSLPLSAECSREAHRQLVADNVLASSDCSDPSDLSDVAEVVFSKTGAQDDLVNRMPRAGFRNAKPNDGYLIAAALLRERALQDVLNLNFDHAAKHALSEINAGPHVGVIDGPDDHGQMVTCNLVYLHRDADADPKEWVLRKSELEKAWKDGWEQYITARTLTVPIVIFIGLGSPAAVLLETCKKIKAAISTQKVFLVDPRPLEESAFAIALGIDSSTHVQEGWGNFMLAAGSRIATEQTAILDNAINALATRENIPNEDCSAILSELRDVGLLQLGWIRAAWLAAERGYMPSTAADPELLADLILAIANLQRLTTTRTLVTENGNVLLSGEEAPTILLIPASGGGTKSIATLEAAVASRVMTRRPNETCVVLVTGALDSPGPTPPADVVVPPSEEDIVRPRAEPIYVASSTLRTDPNAVLEAVS